MENLEEKMSMGSTSDKENTQEELGQAQGLAQSAGRSGGNVSEMLPGVGVWFSNVSIASMTADEKFFPLELTTTVWIAEVLLAPVPIKINFLNSQSFRYHDVKHLGDLFLFFGQLTSNDFSFVNFAF